MMYRLAKTTALFIALAAWSHAGSGCWAQEPEDWDWVNTHFEAVLDELLPIDQPSWMYIGYRSYRDLYTDVLEYSFVFQRAWGERHTTAAVRMADSVSLYDQMMALHRKEPSASIESIKARLKVREFFLASDSCGAIEELTSAFYKMKVLPADEATIILHPLVHTFEAQVSGGTMKLELTDDEQPLVRWAKKARRSLERCATKRQQSRD